MAEPFTVGLDVGGANLKVAVAGGEVRRRPLARWKQPDRLAAELSGWLAGLPGDRLAVTMTGELCDCYATKAEGVARILDAVESAAVGRPVRVWLTDGRLAPPAEARREPLLAGASNWHALATYAGRFAGPGPAVLIDMGSTTTDIIPLADGVPVPAGRTDFDRLRAGELVYVGTRRTPVCALLGPEGMAELFATTADAMVLLGRLPEDVADLATADGRPLTRPNCHARLARMLGHDATTLPEREAVALAEEAHRRMREWVAAGFTAVAGRLPGPPRTAITCGEGESIAREACPAARVVSLGDRCGPDFSSAAPAAALALLAAERWPDDTP